jgi:hypothetical protein
VPSLSGPSKGKPRPPVRLRAPVEDDSAAHPIRRPSIDDYWQALGLVQVVGLGVNRGVNVHAILEEGRSDSVELGNHGLDTDYPPTETGGDPSDLGRRRRRDPDDRPALRLSSA